MSIYRQFCEETFDENGMLRDFQLKYPYNYNFGYDVVDEIAHQEPDKRALVWCNTEGRERIFSFGDISALSTRAANVFRAHGIKKGDRVMVMLKRCYEYWYTAVALHKLGAVLIPVTHMLTSDDIVYRIEAADIRGVVCVHDEAILSHVSQAIARTKSVTAAWTIEGAAQGFMDLTSQVEAAPDTMERELTLATEPMIMYFTSGTTGYPKGVIHDHTYSLAHILTAKYWQNVEDGGLHLTVAETGWGKASWGKI